MVIVIFAWRVTLNCAYSHFIHLKNRGRLYYNFCNILLYQGYISVQYFFIKELYWNYTYFTEIPLYFKEFSLYFLEIPLYFKEIPLFH